MSTTTGFVYDPTFLTHKTAGSPECPERLLVILNKLQQDVTLWNKLKHLKPRNATTTEILRCHREELINHLKMISPTDENSYNMADPDTVLSKDSLQVAYLAAGAALVATDHLFKNEIQNAFCLVRPPGHHATSTEAMGFCLFNNAAIAARYAQDHYGIENVLIIDWDVHHGNGTQEIFYADPSVFYFSMHEYPFYPGTGSENETGTGKAIGRTLNIPLKAGFPADQYREKFSNALKEIENKFKPELIIISAGFDARKGDPLADLQLTGKDYAEMTKEVKQFANRHCQGKIISLLEGGYVTDTLGEVVHQHILALS
jgi:acetoin utilization deacetylase AcuC-like enzyme